VEALLKSQRREQRREVDQMILYRLPGESNFKPAQVKNISHHGLFMQTMEILDIGGEAEVIISPYNSDSDPIQVTVEIVHIQAAEMGCPNGYGCKVTSSNCIEIIDI